MRITREGRRIVVAIEEEQLDPGRVAGEHAEVGARRARRRPEWRARPSHPAHGPSRLLLATCRRVLGVPHFGRRESQPACQSAAAAGLQKAQQQPRVGRQRSDASGEWRSRRREFATGFAFEVENALPRPRPMDTRWSGEAKYQTLLAVSQAANARRELSSVLEAVMGALDGLVPVDLAGVVTRGTGGLRALAAHFRSVPRRPGESHGSYVERISEAAGVREEVDEESFVRQGRRAGPADAGRRPHHERRSAGEHLVAADGCRVRRRAAIDDGRRGRGSARVRAHDASALLARRGPDPRGPGPAGHHRGGERARLRGDPEASGPARGREPRPARGDRRDRGGGRDHRGFRRAARRARAGSARGGDRLDRADHRRDRDRQGARGSRHSHRVAPSQARAGQGQLRGAARGARRVRAVRPREGSLHRRSGAPQGPLRAGLRGHDLPRRGGRAAGAGPGRPLARAAGARVRARGRP